ncbi:hypothetical protein HPHPH1_0134 [Helicobacter pylori Hp H-1]|uniref:Uncharacterized protein n=1 Tax=Helicobacter pylori Hp H-1 TaxID=992058 RepID=M7S5A8_HELPX|nr:hypothetical protein HPHPH1_0134 [Helicobacter pylori Hp H-1]
MFHYYYYPKIERSLKMVGFWNAFCFYAFNCCVFFQNYTTKHLN